MNHYSVYSSDCGFGHFEITLGDKRGAEVDAKGVVRRGVGGFSPSHQTIVALGRRCTLSRRGQLYIYTQSPGQNGFNAFCLKNKVSVVSSVTISSEVNIAIKQCSNTTAEIVMANNASN